MLCPECCQPALRLFDSFCGGCLVAWSTLLERLEEERMRGVMVTAIEAIATIFEI
jgi:hypothetical protein